MTRTRYTPSKEVAKSYHIGVSLSSEGPYLPIRYIIMAKMIYYGDNLFLVGEMIRVLKDGLQLEIDPALFSDKIVEDIFFVDTALVKLYESLAASPLLIDRNDHLKSLMRAENLFSDLLQDLIDERLRLGADIRPLFERFEELISSHRARVEEIRKIIAESEPAVGESGDMISPAEYEFLLIDKESEE